MTLMRTTPEENDRLGKEIAQKASAARGPTAVLVPLRGVSAIDAEGQPFAWPEADQALFRACGIGWSDGGIDRAGYTYQRSRIRPHGGRDVAADARVGSAVRTNSIEDRLVRTATSSAFFIQSARYRPARRS